MTKYEQLRENYEDALFALLINDMAEQEGQRLLEENERLKNDPSAAIPDDINRKGLLTIKRAYAKEQHRKVRRNAYQIFRQVAVVAVIGMLLFTTAFAAFPEVRIKTLNLLIEVSDVSTSLSLAGESPDAKDSTTASPNASYDQIILHGYKLPLLPNEYTVESTGSERLYSWIHYVGMDGAEIYCSIATADGSVLNTDTENAQQAEAIQIQGYDGLLITKESNIDIVWGDTDHNSLISIYSSNLNEEFLIEYANSIFFVGNN